MAFFHPLFKSNYAESFVLLAKLIQIATRFTKRALVKEDLCGFYRIRWNRGGEISLPYSFEIQQVGNTLLARGGTMMVVQTWQIHKGEHFSKFFLQ
jgi:hypothetical protein